MRIALLVAMVLGGFAAGDEPAVAPAPRSAEPLDRLAGRWVETSVRWAGEELLDPPGTSNRMTFDGTKFTECYPSGKPFLTGEIKLVKAGKGVWEIDLPHKIIVNGKSVTVTVAAVARPLGRDKLQIAYFDPELIPPEKRPAAFESTRENGVVLITLRRLP